MKIIFYNDSPVFGGHEIMTFLGLQALCEDPTILLDFIYCQENKRAEEKLLALSDKYPNLKSTPVNIQTRKLQSLRNNFMKNAVSKLGEMLQSKNPDLVVVIQGDIEISSLCLMAVNRFNIPNVSYIPHAHTLKRRGAKLGAIRDIFNTYLYKLPKAYITISEEIKSTLQERGANCPIQVVYNGIDLSKFKASDKNLTLINNYNLPKNRKIIGMIGRIEYKQKGHDLFVDMLNKNRDLLQQIHTIIIGDGKDKNKLEEAINHSGFKEHVTFLSWQDPAELYPLMDFLLLPSYYEGFPLVMIEALACKVPVIGTNVDGMAELLPKEWQFELGNSDSLRNVLLKNLDIDHTSKLNELRRKIEDTMSLDLFKKNFKEKVKSFVQGD